MARRQSKTPKRGRVARKIKQSGMFSDMKNKSMGLMNSASEKMKGYYQEPRQSMQMEKPRRTLKRVMLKKKKASAKRVR